MNNDSCQILVAGVGNIFMGDDAFGVEVAQRLAARPLPSGVRVVDFGIRGLDLAYALLDAKHQATIMVDATARGGAPGTVYLIEPDQVPDGPDDHQAVEAHGMDPMKVLRLVRSMGGEPKRLMVVGCEPLTLGGDEGAMGLSPQVEAGVQEAVSLVESLIRNILAGKPSGTERAA